ncbi:MAG TPA: isoprenoid biosynthesis glyoxalase ElbB [Azospirillaceae bacterium]|nr:isoprenoid biosynthesis glyoxalase ElbB [Azospirillaceae bacterium]
MAGNPLKFGVILSGCGVYDGAEIHESVLTLLAINRHGAEARIYAPNIPQHHVVNHLTGDEMPESRNVLVESARIARGKIADLAAFKTEDVDALILPGGFGAAKNLSDFAVKGPDCTVNPEVERAIKAMVAAGKPVGALCIAPAILAKVLGDVELTIGSDKGTAEALESLGAKHKDTTHGEIVVDRRHKVVTSPCYMLEASVAQIAAGAESTVKALIGLAR